MTCPAPPTDPSEEETERERMLHAMYDAWLDLQRDAELSGDSRVAGVARAILAGQLKAAEYAPFLRRKGVATGEDGACDFS